jgi:heptaprenyl diphosphate synthase
MDVTALLGLVDVQDDLERVDRALHQAVQAQNPFLAEAGGHLARAGGKRFRPALSLAGAAALGHPASEDVVNGGVAVELMHLGSLYHDDVMDDADTRRGVESANARFGNLVAILAGDFLLGRASEIATGIGNDVSAVLARTLVRMCEGQVAELSTAYQVTRSEDAYLVSIRGKTAALMAAACGIGGLCAGHALDSPEVVALTQFGEEFGLAFQIYDDIADVVLSDEELGKPAGHDMGEGVYTLPVLLALTDPVAGPELVDLLGHPLDVPSRDKALTIVRSTDGVTRAIATGRLHADASASALATVPASPVRDALSVLAHRLLDRVA